MSNTLTHTPATRLRIVSAHLAAEYPSRYRFAPSADDPRRYEIGCPSDGGSFELYVTDTGRVLRCCDIEDCHAHVGVEHVTLGPNARRRALSGPVTRDDGSTYYPGEYRCPKHRPAWSGVELIEHARPELGEHYRGFCTGTIGASQFAHPEYQPRDRAELETATYKLDDSHREAGTFDVHQVGLPRGHRYIGTIRRVENIHGPAWSISTKTGMHGGHWATLDAATDALGVLAGNAVARIEIHR